MPKIAIASSIKISKNKVNTAAKQNPQAFRKIKENRLHLKSSLSILIHIMIDCQI